jgi:Caspase domain
MLTELNDYALVIGINDYPFYGPNGRPLCGAIHDARAVGAWLTNKEVGGGLIHDNCKLIVSSMNTVDPPQPRRDKIDDALGEIWKTVEKQAKGGQQPRRFYFYFSGHGQAQLNEDVALCMPNWAKNRQAAALSFRQYLSFIVNCVGFREVVILMDCCRARKIGAKGLECELTCPKPHDNAGKTKIFVAHATEFQASAFEAAAPELIDADEPEVRGHFTEALLTALYGGAARAEGGVPASRLWIFLSKVVPRIARRHLHEQSPKIEPFDIPPDDPAEPIFGGAKPVANVDAHITFSAARNGEIKLEGPDLKIIRKGDAKTGPWDELLPMATYLLTELATGTSKALHLVPTNGVFDVEF